MRTEARYQRYRRAVRYPLFLAGLMFIVGVALALDPHPDTTDQHFHIGRIFTLVAWMVFLADYLISLLLAPDRMQYVRTHVLQAIGVLFPPLRIVLIFHVTYEVAQGSRERFGVRIREYLLYVSTLVIVVTSAAVTVVERNAPGARITSYGDALWWSAETISTVGYGDMYPVTVPGRVIAVLLMANGFTILSVLTATVAQRFVMNPEQGPAPERSPEPEV
jgi:voltage-gated potassium channel